MEPGMHAAERPDSLAVLMGESGTQLTYREMNDASIRLARLLHERGLRPGGHLAVLLPNHHRYFEVVWAGLRSGLYVTPINWHLGPDEAGYILQDSGAEALVTSADFAELIGKLSPYLDAVGTRLVVDGDLDGFESYDEAVAKYPVTPRDGETEGAYMFYSSGTTGRPKGIKPALTGDAFGSNVLQVGLLSATYGFGADSRYLCPAPLYHAAPIGWSIATQRLGGTVVVMEHFDAERALQLIEQHQITNAQFVPTHFVRMLKLPEEVRTRYDHASLKSVVHAAAPCPVDVKQQMMAWWGPIVYEYYAGSEGNGLCAVSPEEWLARPGTVGKPFIGAVHIVDEGGTELGPNQPGLIWFESGATFEYHNDPEKTASAFDAHGWSTLGDVGYVDDEGYLFLTDRISHMIISGGVNIYPQEIENLLVLHPAVSDVAVIGVHHPEMGEEVKAVVQAADPANAGPELAAELITYCRDRLAHFKCPRTVDFVDEMPRLPTGKLLKRVLRDRYAAADAAGDGQ
jgi:long-chain acyl-CoA synthetase